MIPRWPRLAMPFHVQRTAWLDDHVMALRTGSVNCYLYRHDDVLIAFDAGQSPPQLVRALGELARDGTKVQAVFLTHSDPDHSGGLAALPKATVYLGVGEERLLTGRQRRMRLIRRSRFAHEYTLLDDGQVISVAGTEIQAIATPGHTPGSTSYLVEGRYLFVGDTLSLRGGVLAPFVRIINMDHAEQLRSIRKLARLRDVALLCTGHSGVSHSWERLARPWRETGQ